jgi:hypothetical protein
MPTQPCLLCALLPPGSVEAELGRVQDALFSDHGLASASAVPPLVPVAFLGAPEAVSGLLLEMNRSIRAGWRILLQDPAWYSGHLFARVDSAGAWQTLRACALAGGGEEKGGPFPAFEGIYLGCAEAPDSERARISPVIPRRSFSSAALAVLRIEHAGPPEWWRELHWEIIDQRPLRGRRNP